MNYQWSDLVGSLVGSKYPLTEYLGDVGGNGVFSTTASGAPAIVRLAPETGADSLFERWTATVRLSHPNLVRSYDAGRAELSGNQFVYTVTERPDDSLGEAVRARALTADEARDVVKSVLAVLAYLHQQGFVHGSIEAENIVAIGDHVKLGPWTIHRGDEAAINDDMLATGQTIVEILTQHRPATDVQADVATLPPPFGQIARAYLQRRMSASEGLRLLEGGQAATIAHPPHRMKLPMGAIFAAFAAVLVLLLGVRAYKNRTPAQEAVPVVAQAPPQAVRERVVSPPPPLPTRPKGGDWVIVAAIYNDYDLAAKRAESIAKRWKRWQPEVFPPVSQGRRKYMVVLHSADSRKEADRLLARARADGMPSDAYVTKIKRD
jgi:hypothetical protein